MRRHGESFGLGGVLLAIGFCLWASWRAADPVFVLADPTPSPLRPAGLAFRPDGLLAVADQAGGRVLLVDAKRSATCGSLMVGGEPSAVLWSADGGSLWVADRAGSQVCEVGVDGTVRRRIACTARPMALAWSGTDSLLVCGSAVDALSVLDLKAGRELHRIPVCRFPVAVAALGDGRRALVAGMLPAGDARSATYAATLSLVDAGAGTSLGTIRLPPNATGVHGLAIAPDGRFAFVAHAVGRVGLPTTTLDRGWVVTNNLTVLDIASLQVAASIPLDAPAEGAADPWGLQVSADGRRLWVSLAGVHELAEIDLPALQAFIAQLEGDPVVNRLGVLQDAGILQRRGLAVEGPRSLALMPGGDSLAVAGWFSHSLALLPTGGGETSLVRLGAGPGDSLEERGERLFHDGRSCFQHWLSCATCHPEVRVDGLNWDLPNDGIGNPKNVRSLVGVTGRHPVMSLGVRADASTAVRSGFRYIEFREPHQQDVDAVMAFLAAWPGEPSPLSGGDAARRGGELFRGKAACNDCHAGPQLTDLKGHDVGTTTGGPDADRQVITPPLRELWATAPYLHDGSAPDLRAVLRGRAHLGRFGNADQLSEAELGDLIAYLLSL